jgi:hypothetical protein
MASITSNKGICEPVARNSVTANKITPGIGLAKVRRGDCSRWAGPQRIEHVQALEATCADAPSIAARRETSLARGQKEFVPRCAGDIARARDDPRRRNERRTRADELRPSARACHRSALFFLVCCLSPIGSQISDHEKLHTAMNS